MGPPNISDGAVIAAVAPNTDAAAKGLKPGDVILQVGYERISTPNGIPAAFSLLLSQGRTSVALLVFTPLMEQQHWVSVSFLTKNQAEESSRYLPPLVAQDTRPQAPSTQSPDPTLTFLCSANDLASCDKLLAIPLSPDARQRVLELQRNAMRAVTPDFEGRLEACRSGNKSQCDDLRNHALAKHRLADIEEAERNRIEKLQQEQKRREEYPTNLAACERYDLFACKRISPTLLFVPGTGFSENLDEINKNTIRFNAALENAEKFGNYLRDCVAKKRSACEAALAMRNITPDDRARVVQMKAALPWFDLDDPTDFKIAIIVVPILGVLLFLLLARRSPATLAEQGRLGSTTRADALASSASRPGFRSRLARMIDPSLQPGALQTAVPAPQPLQSPSSPEEAQAEPTNPPRDPQTARNALGLAHSYLSEIPDTLESEIADAPELAGQYRSTLALAAKQLDIAQHADPTQKLFIENEDEPPVTITQQRLRARLIQLEALTWGVENPRREIQLLTQATEIDPTMASAFHSLGSAHFHSRNRASAIAALETALTLDPDDIEIIKLLDRSHNMSDAEIATYKVSNVAAKTASAGIKTWHGMKLAGAIAVLAVPLFTIASFTGSMSQAFFIMLVGPPMLWLLARVVRFVGR